MEIRFFKSSGIGYVTCSLSEGKLALAQFSPPRLLQVISFRESNYDSYDISPDGRLLVAGYWRKRGLDVWDLKSGNHLDRFGPNHVARVRFDSTGRYVLIHSDWRLTIRDLKKSVDIKLKNCRESYGVCIRSRDETMLIPGKSKGQIFVFHSSNGAVDEIQLSGHDVISSMVWSPSEDQLFMVEDNHRVSLRQEVSGTPAWVFQFGKDQVPTHGMFSGDCRLIGVTDVHASAVWVLDSDSGRVTRKLDNYFAFSRPFEGTKVMNGDGRILDLATGEVEEGVSNWRWWRAIGV